MLPAYRWSSASYGHWRRADPQGTTGTSRNRKGPVPATMTRRPARSNRRNRRPVPTLTDRSKQASPEGDPAEVSLLQFSAHRIVEDQPLCYRAGRERDGAAWTSPARPRAAAGSSLSSMPTWSATAG